jgi:hypothetical protein
VWYQGSRAWTRSANVAGAFSWLLAGTPEPYSGPPGGPAAVVRLLSSG